MPPARWRASSSFGLDAIGSYGDINYADTIVLWDINLAKPTRALLPHAGAEAESILRSIISLSAHTTH
jgi:hypothetical protein